MSCHGYTACKRTSRKRTLPKYLSSSSTYLWMISSVMSSLSWSSIAQQKYRLAYLQHSDKAANINSTTSTLSLRKLQHQPDKLSRRADFFFFNAFLSLTQDLQVIYVVSPPRSLRKRWESASLLLLRMAVYCVQGIHLKARSRMQKAVWVKPHSAMVLYPW